MRFPSLLIVDDDPLIREGLAISFSGDFTIYQAESRTAAIDLLRQLPSPPQLALIDLGLPPFPFFPFEVPLYEAAGVDVERVGHPLVDIVKPALSKEEAFRKFGLDPKRRTIGLLPGSRTHEMKRLLPPLLAVGSSPSTRDSRSPIRHSFGSRFY